MDTVEAKIIFFIQTNTISVMMLLMITIFLDKLTFFVIQMPNIALT